MGPIAICKLSIVANIICTEHIKITSANNSPSATKRRKTNKGHSHMKKTNTPLCLTIGSSLPQTTEILIHVFGDTALRILMGKKKEHHFSIKIAALQSLQATWSFVKNHENANLPAALHQRMFGKAHASMKLTR